MPKREALRELQIRLAKRLQAAQSEGMAVSWLAVRSGGHHYLLPLAQSGEIVPLAQLQPVPYTRDWFRGVLNIRGNLWGVVDLAGLVAASGGAPALAAAPGTQPSVVTLNAQLELSCGLQVDSLAGLRGTDAFASSTPAEPDAPAYFGPSYVDAQGDRWQEINLRALAQSAVFLSIGAQSPAH